MDGRLRRSYAAPAAWCNTAHFRMLRARERMLVDLPAELARKIFYMVLQMRYPYAVEGRSARAPRRRMLLQPPYTPDLAPLGLFNRAWPRWERYINIRRANDQRRGLTDHYIMTGSLINRLRLWIRRAIARITRRRLYDNDGGSPNPVPTYGVRYPNPTHPNLP